MPGIGALGILGDMLDYAYISLRGASARDAAERASLRLAQRYPGCKASIVDEGRMADGSPWIAVRFDIPRTVPASKYLGAFSADLYGDDIAFWRVMMPKPKAAKPASPRWQPAPSAAC